MNSHCSSKGLNDAKRLRKRYRAEKRFRIYGVCGIALALFFLVVLFVSITSVGWSTIGQTKIKLDINLPTLNLDYEYVVKKALFDLFPQVTSRNDRRLLLALLSTHAAYELEEAIDKQPERTAPSFELWVSASGTIDQINKGRGKPEIVQP